MDHMISRAIVIASLTFMLAACGDAGMPRQPLVNSGSYDWTDQVRDAQGYPLPGWANAIGPAAGNGGPL
jgi:hypothetical protein